MHQDPFVSTGGLSFHPPTPSNIIASKSRDGIYRSPLSLYKGPPRISLCKNFFFFPKSETKQMQSRWTADEERKEGKRKERGNRKWRGRRRPACTIDWSWHILPLVLHPGFMGKSSTAGLLCGLLFLRYDPPLLLHSETFSRHSIPRSLPHPCRSIDLECRSRFTRRETWIERWGGSRLLRTRESWLWIFVSSRWTMGLTKFERKENGENKVCN